MVRYNRPMSLSVFSLMADNQAALTAAGASAVTTLSVAAATPPPDSLLGLLPYVVTVCGPALVLVINRILSSKAARKRVLAERRAERARGKLERARILASDTDPTNDAAARAEIAEAELELDQAAAEAAEADALEALRHRPGGGRE